MKKRILMLAACLFMQPLISSAQPQVKENIEEIKKKIKELLASLAQIKSNTEGFSELSKNLKSKSEIFSPEFLSGDVFEQLKESMKEFTARMTEEGTALRQFRGPDLRCGPGSECFKFKREIGDVFRSMESLKTSLFGAGMNLGLGSLLGELTEKSPGFGLFPLYATVGPLVSSLSKSLNNLAKNMDALAMNDREMKLGPEIKLHTGRGPSPDDMSVEKSLDQDNPTLTFQYLDGLTIQTPSPGIPSQAFSNPGNTIDTNIATIELDNLCTRQLKLPVPVLVTMKESLKIVSLVAKVMQENEGKEFEAGGSFFGHAAIKLKLNSIKKLGIALEVITDTADDLFDNHIGNREKCEDRLVQKAIADNQRIIMENQKILLEMISTLQAKKN